MYYLTGEFHFVNYASEETIKKALEEITEKLEIYSETNVEGYIVSNQEEYREKFPVQPGMHRNEFVYIKDQRKLIIDQFRYESALDPDGIREMFDHYKGLMKLVPLSGLMYYPMIEPLLDLQK